MSRFACLGAFFLAFALTRPAFATGGCGVSCHSTSQGACVRDGWQEGLPVGTSARLRPGQLPPAAPITDGVGNP
jgi:hypothetical protein